MPGLLALAILFGFDEEPRTTRIPLDERDRKMNKRVVCIFCLIIAALLAVVICAAIYQ